MYIQCNKEGVVWREYSFEQFMNSCWEEEPLSVSSNNGNIKGETISLTVLTRARGPASANTTRIDYMPLISNWKHTDYFLVNIYKNHCRVYWHRILAVMAFNCPPTFRTIIPLIALFMEAAHELALLNVFEPRDSLCDKSVSL